MRIEMYKVVVDVNCCDLEFAVVTVGHHFGGARESGSYLHHSHQVSRLVEAKNAIINLGRIRCRRLFPAFQPTTAKPCGIIGIRILVLW